MTPQQANSETTEFLETDRQHAAMAFRDSWANFRTRNSTWMKPWEHEAKLNSDSHTHYEHNEFLS